MFVKKFRAAIVLTLLGSLFSVTTAAASDTDELTSMLHAFLAGVGDAAVHDRFWADDLIYTSSRGTRTTKAENMRGFDADDDDESAAAEPVFTAEDIKIQTYGSTAVVAFRLVATPPPGQEKAAETAIYYLNTGTFLKRNGVWQVVAWQATVVQSAD